MQNFYIIKYWKTFIILLIIFLLSTIQFKSVPSVATFSHIDKVMHFIMYAGLSFVAMWEYSRDNSIKHKYKRFLWVLFIFFALFGGSIELVQEFLFKPRSAEWLDWVADILGLLAGFVFGALIFNSKHRSKSKINTKK